MWALGQIDLHKWRGGYTFKIYFLKGYREGYFKPQATKRPKQKKCKKLKFICN